MKSVVVRSAKAGDFCTFPVADKIDWVNFVIYRSTSCGGVAVIVLEKDGQSEKRCVDHGALDLEDHVLHEIEVEGLGAYPPYYQLSPVFRTWIDQEFATSDPTPKP